MSEDFSGCRVMISGAASGIGFAIAAAFSNKNALVEICDVSDNLLSDAARALPNIGVYKADISIANEVDSWFEHAHRSLGGLDILINNAGIAGPTAHISDISVDDWDHTMAVNIRGHFLCTRRAVKPLMSSNRATIINLSSVAGRLGYPLRTPYAASKWAVIGMTQSLAVELGDSKITVNAILPGIVKSDRTESVIANKAHARNISVEIMRSEILEHVALHQMVPMKDIADTALFLASETGRSITGQCMNICAGVQSLR